MEICHKFKLGNQETQSRKHSMYRQNRQKRRSPRNLAETMNYFPLFQSQKHFYIHIINLFQQENVNDITLMYFKCLSLWKFHSNRRAMIFSVILAQHKAKSLNWWHAANRMSVLWSTSSIAKMIDRIKNWNGWLSTGGTTPMVVNRIFSASWETAWCRSQLFPGDRDGRNGLLPLRRPRDAGEM